MTRDGESELTYVPTAEMLADYITKPLSKHTFLMQCTAIGMIGIGLRNCIYTNGSGLGIRIVNGVAIDRGTIGNGQGNGIRSGHGIGNALRM
jgi:hypothetical protein